MTNVLMSLDKKYTQMERNTYSILKEHLTVQNEKIIMKYEYSHYKIIIKNCIFIKCFTNDLVIYCFSNNETSLQNQ